MEMIYIPAKQTSAMAPFSQVSHELISVMRRLTDVITQENKCLMKGIPASLSEMVDRKVELSDECDEKWAVVRRAIPEKGPIDQAIRDQLCAEATKLQAVARRNADLLQAAMHATRRRIEAIMSVIRLQAGDAVKYSGNGEKLLVHFIPGRNNLKI